MGNRSIFEVGHEVATLQDVVETFKQGEEIVHFLLLCTVGVEMWDSFSTGAKRELLAGLPGDTKAALGLDAA